MSRSYLVLQGTASLFFARLSDALRQQGHTVRKVNFCGGDLLYGGADALNYTGRFADLPEWYADVVNRFGITDVLMFGDCREVHRHMHPVAAMHKLRVHVFEEGYVRPHWITLESHGVNGRSLLSRDPAWYFDQREVVIDVPSGMSTGYNLRERAFHDIVYRGANAVLANRFRGYRSHRPRNGFLEYMGLAARALRQGQRAKEADEITSMLVARGHDYYLFPLQLNSDAQMVVHSPFSGVREAIKYVVQSFAECAPEDSWLILKNHPLDTGLIDYRKFATALALESGICERFRFIDSGHLPTLLEHARGVVVVNSTVGLSALHHRRPLAALGAAIYNMPGLTWQGDLNSFWLNAECPNVDLYEAFLNYVLSHTQINGDFYTRTGIEMAVAGTVKRLEAAAHA